MTHEHLLRQSRLHTGTQMSLTGSLTTCAEAPSGPPAAQQGVFLTRPEHIQCFRCPCCASAERSAGCDPCCSGHCRWKAGVARDPVLCPSVDGCDFCSSFLAAAPSTQMPEASSPFTTLCAGVPGQSCVSSQVFPCSCPAFCSVEKSDMIPLGAESRDKLEEQIPG